MRRWKRLAALTLSGVLSAGMAFQALAAAKLAAPQNVKWSDEREANIVWDAVEGAAGKYKMEFYRNGSLEKSSNWSMNINNTSGSYTADGYLTDLSESGIYKFRIMARGDSIDTLDSDWSEFSEDWNFVMPDVKFGQPTNLRWEGTTAKWDMPDDAVTKQYLEYGGGYDIWLYEDDTRVQGVCWSTSSLDKQTEEDLAEYMTGENAEKYTFQVRVLSNTPSKIFHSDWVSSDGSYNPGDENAVIGGIIDGITSGGDINQAPDALKDADIKKVQVAMQTDPEILGKIADLENSYVAANSIETGKTVSEDTGMSADDIEIIGMGLNAKETGGSVIFNAKKPEKAVVVDSMAYKNTVQIDFSLEGAVNELKVPVRITIPIPENINPDFFHVLHYHADGTVEDLKAGFELQINKEERTASFTVTSFSVFVLAEEGADSTNVETPSNADEFEALEKSLPDTLPGDEEQEAVIAGTWKLVDAVRNGKVKADQITEAQVTKIDGLLKEITELEGTEVFAIDSSAADTAGVYLAAYSLVKNQRDETLADEDRLAEAELIASASNATPSNASEKLSFELVLKLTFADGTERLITDLKTPLLAAYTTPAEYGDSYQTTDQLVLPGGKKVKISYEDGVITFTTTKLGSFRVVKGTSSSSSSGRKPTPAGGGNGSGSVVISSPKQGTWKQDATGWWYQYVDGTWPKSQWAELEWNNVRSWYYFDENGYMATGWKQDGGYTYYLHPTADGTRGHMYTGWHEINSLWYYFSTVSGGPKGSLLTSTTTPDGYQVNADGVWVSNQ